MASKRLSPIPPGEVLLEDFMHPLDISINALARDLDVPPNRISQIVNGQRAISADTALRLARYFGTSAELWMNLQAGHDLRVAQRESGASIRAKVRPRQTGARAA